MAWWKKKSRCELCSAKLPTGSVLSEYKNVYVAEGDTKVVRDICAACWQRHLPLEAEAEARFRRENPFEDVVARLQDGDAQVRAEAAWQLARLGDKRGVAALCDVLVTEGWRFPVVEAVVNALGVLGGPKAESALIAELHNEQAWYEPNLGDQPMRCRADYIVPALVKVGGNALMLRALFDTMASKTLPPSVRADAANYLAGMASRSNVGYSLTGWGGGYLTRADRELMVDPLRAALRDESARVRKSAAWGLGNLGNTRALQDLLDLIGDDDFSVRYRAAEALGELGDRRAAQALRRALEDDRDLGVVVQEALTKLK